MSSYFLCGVIQVSMKGRDSSCIHVGENVTQPAPTFMLQSSNIFSCSVVFEITSHKQLSASVFSEVACTHEPREADKISAAMSHSCDHVGINVAPD